MRSGPGPGAGRWRPGGRLYTALLLWALVAWAPGERLSRRARAEVSRAPIAPRRRTLRAIAAALGVSAATAQSASTWEHFAEADRDGDGRVDANEFTAVVSGALGVTSLETLQYFRRMFLYADIDGDGVLNPQEAVFAELLCLQAAAEGGADVRELLGSGQAPLAPAAAHACLLWAAEMAPGDGPDEFGQHAVEALMEGVDADGDGRLSWEEYDAGMRIGLEEWEVASFADPAKVAAWVEEMFVQADADGDGSLSMREAHYAEILLEIGRHREMFAAARLALVMFQELDRNEDGRIDPREIRSAAADDAAYWAEHVTDAPLEASAMQQMAACWRDFDMDRDGALDRREAAELAARLIANDSRGGPSAASARSRAEFVSL